MAAAAKPTTCKYSVGDQVEVLMHDFRIPGFPRTWQAGPVVEVADRENGLHGVCVALETTTETGVTVPHWEIVGPRGGNKNIRPAISAPVYEVGECDHCGGAHLNADH